MPSLHHAIRCKRLEAQLCGIWTGIVRTDSQFSHRSGSANVCPFFDYLQSFIGRVVHIEWPHSAERRERGSPSFSRLPSASISGTGSCDAVCQRLVLQERERRVHGLSIGRTTTHPARSRYLTIGLLAARRMFVTRERHWLSLLSARVDGYLATVRRSLKSFGDPEAFLLIRDIPGTRAACLKPFYLTTEQSYRRRRLQSRRTHSHRQFLPAPSTLTQGNTCYQRQSQPGKCAVYSSCWQTCRAIARETAETTHACACCPSSRAHRALQALLSRPRATARVGERMTRACSYSGR
jgi:hypothetical protein